MNETPQVILTLKKALKSKHLTYADVARGLDMSEGNVKRLFASGRMTLDRIESICRLMDLSLAGLFKLYDDSQEQITQLSVAQEQQLVDDTILLLVAVCVRNRRGFQDILDNYRISEPVLIRKLVQLDRLKIIDLLPNNRVKLRIQENFRWIPNGPIERYSQELMETDFLRKGFDREHNPRLFLSGLVSESSKAFLARRVMMLANEFNQICRQDSELPLAQLRSVCALVALREWEFPLFTPYVREPKA